MPQTINDAINCFTSLSTAAKITTATVSGIGIGAAGATYIAYLLRQKDEDDSSKYLNPAQNEYRNTLIGNLQYYHNSMKKLEHLHKRVDEDIKECKLQQEIQTQSLSDLLNGEILQPIAKSRYNFPILEEISEAEDLSFWDLSQANTAIANLKKINKFREANVVNSIKVESLKNNLRRKKIENKKKLRSLL